MIAFKNGEGQATRVPPCPRSFARAPCGAERWRGAWLLARERQGRGSARAAEQGDRAAAAPSPRPSGGCARRESGAPAVRRAASFVTRRPRPSRGPSPRVFFRTGVKIRRIASPFVWFLEGAGAGAFRGAEGKDTRASSTKALELPFPSVSRRRARAPTTLTRTHTHNTHTHTLNVLLFSASIERLSIAHKALSCTPPPPRFLSGSRKAPPPEKAINRCPPPLYGPCPHARRAPGAALLLAQLAPRAPEVLKTLGTARARVRETDGERERGRKGRTHPSETIPRTIHTMAETTSLANAWVDSYLDALVSCVFVRRARAREREREIGAAMSLASFRDLRPRIAPNRAAPRRSQSGPSLAHGRPRPLLPHPPTKKKTPAHGGPLVRVLQEGER